MIGKWSRWRKFPDPGMGKMLVAPFGPGVYEVRNRDTLQRVLFGRSKNVAKRMSSLLPRAYYGAGGRNNESKKRYVFDHLSVVEYRTLACSDEEMAKQEEKVLKARREDYIFPEKK